MSNNNEKNVTIPNLCITHLRQQQDQTLWKFLSLNRMLPQLDHQKRQKTNYIQTKVTTLAQTYYLVSGPYSAKDPTTKFRLVGHFSSRDHPHQAHLYNSEFKKYNMRHSRQDKSYTTYTNQDSKIPQKWWQQVLWRPWRWQWRSWWLQEQQVQDSSWCILCRHNQQRIWFSSTVWCEQQTPEHQMYTWRTAWEPHPTQDNFGTIVSPPHAHQANTSPMTPPDSAPKIRWIFHLM